MSPVTRPTYLDYAASAPTREEALVAERAYEASEIAGANPNSLHTLGRAAARALDGARADLARCAGGRFRPSDVILTSGGTESNNLAVLGLAEGARARASRRRSVVLSAIEHDSVLDLAPVLRERGFEVRLARPGRDGVVRPAALEGLVDETCALVSVMAANNETGVCQPVGELARAAHAAGALFHTDAVQAFGHLPLDLADVDAASVAAHKLGGPVGVGALLVRGRAPLRPLTFGGGQERGLRAGTQDVRGALAFAAAARAACGALPRTVEAVSRRAERLARRLCAPGTGPRDGRRALRRGVAPPRHRERHGARARLRDARPRARPGRLRGLRRLGLLLRLARREPRPSRHGGGARGALGSLRVSFDERVGDHDLDRLAEALLDIVRDHAGDRRRGRR